MIQKFCCKGCISDWIQMKKNSGRKQVLVTISGLNNYILLGSLIKCTVPAASCNNKPMWHLCLPRHYSS